MLLNKFPRETDAEVKKQTQQTVPLAINDVPTYLHKFLKAQEKNPLKDNLFVTQISSVEELQQRSQQTAEYLGKVQERMAKTKQFVQSSREALKHDCTQRLDKGHELNRLLQKKLQQIYGKLEMVAQSKGNLKVESAKQQSLKDAQCRALAATDHER